IPPTPKPPAPLSPPQTTSIRPSLQVLAPRLSIPPRTFSESSPPERHPCPPSRSPSDHSICQRHQANRNRSSPVSRNCFSPPALPRQQARAGSADRQIDRPSSADNRSRGRTATGSISRRDRKRCWLFRVSLGSLNR